MLRLCYIQLLCSLFISQSVIPLCVQDCAASTVGALLLAAGSLEVNDYSFTPNFWALCMIHAYPCGSQSVRLRSDLEIPARNSWWISCAESYPVTKHLIQVASIGCIEIIRKHPERNVFLYWLVPPIQEASEVWFNLTAGFTNRAID